MNDDYAHNDIRVMYVVENIPGPKEQNEEYKELFEKFNSQLTESCKCDVVCIETHCTCLQISGGHNYVQNILSKKNVETRPIIECNSLCPCLDDCGNRLVQKGPINGLIVKSCANETKGMGLFNKHAIPKRTFICEYAGEVITKSQALKRHNLNVLQGKMNFIYCLNEHSNSGVIQTFIDPSTFGNIGRYINHSCDPNTEIIPVRVDSPIPKLAIFSCKDILPDTEITFDYGSSSECSILDGFNIKGNKDVNSRKKCFCGSPICKGMMPYEVY